jgi:bifunctional DNA-binding transcriptional regulator/antitoxin component of YhaV-PrlF toxin-antitoxin module
MRIAIDAAGRLVVPKSLRTELGITGPAEVEVVWTDGRLELSVPDTPARVEMRDGLAVIVPQTPAPPMSAQAVRETLERVRR